VFDDAGYPQKLRHGVFQGKRTGPYANVSLLKPGDWVMLMNGESGGEHSAIFVRWESRPAKIAQMLDYVGGKRPTTGHMSHKAISRIFAIVRAGKKTK
jgi:hypothetical protein